jgi:adenylate kinase family enzyme
MRIQILYQDNFDRSGNLLIEKLIETEKYILIDFGDLLRNHINNKTENGILLSSFIDSGRLVPSKIMNDVVVETLNISKTDKVLLKNYPKSKDQIELFINYCKSKNIEIEKAWHMISKNILTNLDKIPHESSIAAKYKSHDYIKMNWERSNTANSESLIVMAKHCKTVVFESEAYGINYELDKIRINNHT